MKCAFSSKSNMIGYAHSSGVLHLPMKTHEPDDTKTESSPFYAKTHTIRLQTHTVYFNNNTVIVKNGEFAISN